MIISNLQKVSKPFNELTSKDVTGYGQKGVNCGLILQDLKEIVSQTKTKSDIPIIAVPGFVFSARAYRNHVNKWNLIPKIQHILDKFNKDEINQYECSAKIYTLFDETELDIEVKQEISNNRDNLIRQVAEILNISFDEVLGSISLYFRSNADIGEDGQISEGFSLEEIADMIGAGKHESYGQNYTIESCYKAYLQTMASTFSPQACGQYKGHAGFTQKWLQLEVNMCVIQMVEVHSLDVGSALVFGEITGEWIDINLGKNLKGDDLVGGAEIGLVVSYHKPTQSIDYKSNPTDFLSDNTIEAIAQTAEIIGIKNDLTPDTEWSFGALIKGSKIYFIVPVQFRDDTPVEVEKKTTTLEVHEIKSLPSEEYMMAKGLVSVIRCGVGEVVFSRNKTKNKIFIADEANPSYSGLIREALGFIFLSGALNCHMGLMTRGRKPALFSATIFKELVENDVITILGDKAYLGDWSENFDINFLDLLKCKIPKKTKAKFVDDGNTAFLGDLYPWLALGLSDGYDLLRMEASNVAHGIPNPLSFIHYDKLDLSTEAGCATKAYIDNAMAVYKTTDPQVAYRKLSVAKLARPMALCKQFGKNCSVRLYGARLNEHDHNLRTGFLPYEANPMFGYNGIPMYLEDWGKDVLKLSVQVLDDLRQIGYDNTELFIPNVATIQGLETVLEMIKSWGIDPTQWELKPMMETQEFCSKKNLLALKKLADTYGFRKVVISWGLNDYKNATAGFDLRMHTSKDGRGNIESERYTDEVSEIIEFGNSIGIHSSSCGLSAPKMMQAMQNANAISVGFPPGQDFYEGLQILSS